MRTVHQWRDVRIVHQWRGVTCSQYIGGVTCAQYTSGLLMCFRVWIVVQHYQIYMLDSQYIHNEVSGKNLAHPDNTQHLSAIRFLTLTACLSSVCVCVCVCVCVYVSVRVRVCACVRACVPNLSVA